MNSTALTHPTQDVPRADRAVALGVFDGVHLGHRRVLAGTLGAQGLTSAVLSFGDGAAALKANAVRLCSAAYTASLLTAIGVEEWFQADFEAFRHLSPEAFVRDVLCGQLGAKRVCCGFNFRFGKGGVGTVDTLRTLCAQYGVELVVATELSDNGGTVSSDRIRRLIEAGEIETATRLLGHPFVIDTPVIHGQALGRTLGTPTANQTLPEGFVMPRFGVYMSTAVIGGKSYYGVTNIGVRPTVGGSVPRAETWFEGFDGDLYDQPLRVVLTRFLREEKRFASVEELKAQIVADCEHARTLRSDDEIRAVLFDFDDTLQNRPAAFRRFGEYFLQKYRPHLRGEAFEAAFDTMKALNNSGYVDYIQYFTEMPKAVGIENPLPAEVLFREYQRVFPNFVQLFEGCEETLRTLRENGYRLGIVTNGPCVQQHRKLDVSGLRPLLDTVLVSSEEEVAKPDAELFCRAAARLGLSPAQCVFVGDHPVNDIDGAITAGMKAIFLDTRLPSCTHEDVPVCHSVTEILTYL